MERAGGRARLVAAARGGRVECPDTRWWLGRLAAVRWSGRDGEVAPAAGDITITSLHGLAAVDADAVAAQAQSPDNLVFDARTAARYRGDEEPLDPRAGHIPGAVSAPTAENLTADGTFKPVAELRERFEKLGAGAAPVTVYCGSGVTATHQIAALAIAGYDAALYPGSWSEWSSDPQRPVATGPNPA